MPQGLQTAAVGNQLRRSFGLRGLIQTSVDEIVVPIASIADLDRPPFRSEGFSWYSSNRQITGATFGHVGISFDPSIRGRVEKVVITNLDPAQQDYRVALANVSNPGALAVVPELVDGAAVPLGPITIFGIDLVAPAAPPMLRVRLAPGENFTWDCDITLLDATSGLRRFLLVGCDTAGIDVQASFSGRFWPGAFA